MVKMVIFIIGFLTVVTQAGNYPASKQEEMVIKSIYQGKSLFISNPIMDNRGNEFCIKEILINDKKYDIPLKSSAISIDFDSIGLQIGDQFNIILKHNSDCRPELVNPEILSNLVLFEIDSYNLEGNILSFTTKGETFPAPFMVEEFRLDNWDKIGSVQGKGGPGERTYTVEVSPYNGENRFRIYQLNYLNKKIYSQEMVINVQKEPVEITSRIKNVEDIITFSGQTSYSVLDSFGNEVLSGYGSSINVSSLVKGTYFLEYENMYVTFKKK